LITYQTDAAKSIRIWFDLPIFFPVLGGIFGVSCKAEGIPWIFGGAKDWA